jgi:glycine betaine/proline transport system substrate-binding protein
VKKPNYHPFRLGLVLILFLGACTPLAGEAQPGEGVTVRLAQATWDTGWFQAQVYKLLLEELGYTVTDPESLGTVAFYFFTAGGDIDFWANGWFPIHDRYLNHSDILGKAKAVGYQVEAGALQGYLIDKATADRLGITNLGDLQDSEIAAEFDTDGDGKAELIGCNPGWGCWQTVEHQLDDYGLRDTVDQVQGDYSALMSDAIARYRLGEPLLAYTWTPNWTVSELVIGEDVMWLSVPFSSWPDDPEADTEVEGVPGCLETPCNMGFAPSDIRVVANVEFLEANPAASALFELAEIPLEDIADQNVQMKAGESSAEQIRGHAEAWIGANREQVEQWLAAAREAAK